jgi:hypothetical protein
MSLKLTKPTRDPAGNVYASAEVQTRWGPLEISMRVPRGVFEAGAAPLLARGIVYGAEALGQTLVQPPAGVGHASTSLAVYNAERLAEVHEDPTAPLTHVVVFDGGPVVIDEVAHAVARNPSDARSVRAAELARGMADSYDPSQRAYGESEIRKMRAAVAVRALLQDRAALRQLETASREGDEAAIAARQAVVAARFLDGKAGAEMLALRVHAGDRGALHQAQGLLKLALRGDHLANVFSKVFTDTKAALPPLDIAQAPARAPAEAPPPGAESASPPSVAKDPLNGANPAPNPVMDPDELAAAWARAELQPIPPCEPLSQGKDPIVGTVSSDDGGVGC